MDRASFYEMVYQVVKLIPKGRVTSYGAIAKYLGTASSSRMVGYALSAAGLSIEKIPAHRVVNQKGLLSGKHAFGSATRMQELLESEGISVENDQVKNFKKYFWDPAFELDLNK